MKRSSCLCIIVLVFLSLSITQKVNADTAKDLKYGIVKFLSDEIYDKHISIKPGYYHYFPVKLEVYDRLLYFIQITNEVPVTVELLDESDYKKLSNGKSYKAFKAGSEKNVLKYTGDISNDKEDGLFYIVVHNTAILSGTNVKIEVYVQRHDKKKTK